MKTIIILGLTYNQIPLIQKVQEMGYRAVAIGVGGGEPAACTYADAWFPIDTSDMGAVLDLAVRERAVGLVTCGTSTAICTIAYVTEKLKLSDRVISYETAVNATFKDRFRGLIGDLLPSGISATSLEEASAESQRFTFPVVLKPADGGGGKGITVVAASPKGPFTEAYEHALAHSRGRVVIVEELVEGTVVGVESFVLDGAVYVLAIADKLMSAPPHCITLGVAFPTRLDEKIQDRIREVNEEAIDRLGISWGATHIDVAIDKHGSPKIIDIGPRLAGGAISSRLLPSAYQYDLYGATIRLAVGEMPAAPGMKDRNFYGSRFLLAPASGTIRSIRYSEDVARANNILDVTQLTPRGFVLRNTCDDSARLLMFTTKANSYEQVLSNLDLFAASVRVEMA